jgi:hypothetical protein
VQTRGACPHEHIVPRVMMVPCLSYTISLEDCSWSEESGDHFETEGDDDATTAEARLMIRRRQYT